MDDTNVVENKVDNTENEKKLTKKDVIKSWIRWFMFAQSNYNYERLHTLCFPL